jgi:hypothetical protein
MRRYVHFNKSVEATLSVYPDWSRQLYLSDDQHTLVLDSAQVQRLIDDLIPGVTLALEPRRGSTCRPVSVHWHSDDLRFTAEDGHVVRWRRDVRLFVEWLRELDPRRARPAGSVERRSRPTTVSAPLAAVSPTLG